MSDGQAGTDPILTVDLRRQFGEVCIPGTRIPASALAGCVFAGDSVDAVVDSYSLPDFPVTREQVLTSCWWYVTKSRQQHRPSKTDRRILDRWGQWADDALAILGGHTPGPCPDPPVAP